MEVRLLGPVELVTGGRTVRLAGNKQRGVVAALALHANTVVPVDRLVTWTWNGAAPPTAVRQIQDHMSRLRRALGAAPVLHTRASGYELTVRPGELDLTVFRDRVARARRMLVADPERAAHSFDEALAVWRGPALGGVPAGLSGEAERLDELRWTALDGWLEAGLALGRHVELIGELRALIHEYPLRERLYEWLMVALSRTGRRAEALTVYRVAYRRFRDELGLAPTVRLRRLEHAILAGDPTETGIVLTAS